MGPEVIRVASQRRHRYFFNWCVALLGGSTRAQATSSCVRASKRYIQIPTDARDIGAAVTGVVPRKAVQNARSHLALEISKRIFRHPLTFSSAEGGRDGGHGGLAGHGGWYGSLLWACKPQW